MVVTYIQMTKFEIQSQNSLVTAMQNYTLYLSLDAAEVTLELVDGKGDSLVQITGDRLPIIDGNTGTVTLVEKETENNE